MWYLVHTDAHPRPYLTTVPFIARDFRIRGRRVGCHASESDYIKEIRLREKIQNGREWRLELPEIWAREVLSRKEREIGRVPEPEPQELRIAEEEHLSYDEKRLHRASCLAHDFLHGIAAFGECGCKVHDFLLAADRRKAKAGDTHTPFPIDPRPLPPGPTGLISKYMRLVHAIRYNPNAPLPAWADPAIVHADQVIITFHPHPAVRIEHLVHAVSRAVSMGTGRMGRVERNTENGVFTVVLFVDVGDCVAARSWAGADEYTRDPVPVYQRGEGPPAYV